MNYSNILDKFSGLSDLPVSEEEIGAYLEGNLSLDEQLEVEASLAESGDEDILADLSLDDPMPTDDLSDDILSIDILDDNIRIPDIDAFEELYSQQEAPGLIDLSLADAEYAQCADCAFPDTDDDDLTGQGLPGDPGLDMPDDDLDSDFPDTLDF